MSPPRPRYEVIRSLPCVKLAQQREAGKIGVFSTIGAGSQLEIHGPSSLAGMIEVTFQGQRYAVFQTDFEERAYPAAVRSGSRSAA